MKARNPQTGNLETVYVKALDSMPVGTEVDFDGTSANIPTGWEEVSGESQIGYVLFSGTLTGTNSATLSDAVENYEYIEIIGGNSLRQTSAKIHIPTSKRGKLMDIGMDGNVYIKYADIEMSGTTIKINQNREWWKPNNSASGGYNSSGNFITIYRVIGYKEV